MHVLLISPLFPKSFWSLEKTLALIDKKVLIPPLGLITVAAILPQEWEYQLVDCNVSEITEEQWNWADLVVVSAMIVQKTDFARRIQEAKKRGKKVAVGGPYPSTSPEEAKATGADYLILDEGEITLPMFVEALERGETSGVFTANGEKPDVTTTPIPRFELLEIGAYDSQAIQFSRGCPFQCEFCDIIVLYGRKPRTKSPAQLLKELDYLFELGYRGNIFFVDDNFIGNKRNVKLLLKELKPWMEERGYPFRLTTEASVDLAQDQELMDLMTACNFTAVFLGLETPDEESLSLTKKYQNTRDSLTESVDKIIRSGLRVMSGFIIGFDGEKPGAGDRIVRFVEESTIPIAMFSMLQALPNTALWHRLEKEGRLIDSKAGINQTTLINFIPTRPVEDIAREYIDAFWQLYEPDVFLDRTYRHFLKLGNPKKRLKTKLSWVTIRAMAMMFWSQGFVRKSRWKFWTNLFKIIRHRPDVFDGYLTVCAYMEHFTEYRQIVKDQIESQLAEFLAAKEAAELKEKALEKSAA
ncbi:MAG: B12-binding domain-containing radical SAM protein [Cyanobacteriota bacterium]|nr:B12-binding domain-containing radical SAM protein [Cyanobacteriota bacterium]